MPADYESIVQKAMAFMRVNLSRPIKSPDIANAVFYSGAHLRRAFRHVTGSSIRRNLILLRMERARQLLRESELNVSEVSDRVGYRDVFLFSKSFKKHVGMPPSEFRNKARQSFESPAMQPGDAPAGPREWLCDRFQGNELQPWWKAVRGRWRQKNGWAEGIGSPEVTLGLEKPLPENFRLECRVKLEPLPGRVESELTVSIWDHEFSRPYTAFVVGRSGNTIGIHRRERVIVQWNPEATLKPIDWHHVVLRRMGVRSELAVDSHHCFVYVDAFPPSYGLRCKLGLGALLQTASIRDLKIDDLGVETYVPMVRQGDSLFNAGLYDQARDFYLRHLRAVGASDDEAEFRYKIGMCHLGQGSYSQARQWFDRVVPIAENNFWSDQANGARLEADWREKNWGGFRRSAFALFKDVAMHDRVRTTIIAAIRNLNVRGFVQSAVDLARLRVELEQHGPARMLWLARQALGEQMQHWNRPDLAERELREVASSDAIGVDEAVEAMRALRNILLFQGKNREAIQVIDRIRATGSHYGTTECDCYHSLVFRAMGRPEKALGMMHSIARREKNNIGGGPFLWRHTVATLYAMGRLGESRQLLKQGSRLWPRRMELSVGRRSESFYPLYLLEGDAIAAAKLVAEDFRSESSFPFIHAEQAVKAGILFELGDESGKARDMWSQGVRRYPSTDVYYYADLSKALIQNRRDNLEGMPFPAWPVSEMAYLVGLLMEKRGNAKRAMGLFEMSVEMDPTNRWPSVWAKEKVSSIQ